MESIAINPEHNAVLNKHDKKALLEKLLQQKLQHAAQRSTNQGALGHYESVIDEPVHYGPVHYKPAQYEAIQYHAMSKGQESLWFIHQSDPTSAAYNLASAIRIYSPVDVQALERALNICVGRHAALRTCYGIHAEKNTQIVHSDAPVELIRVDATMLNDDELHQRINADYQQPFDLTQLPILRAYWYQVSKGESVFMFVVHHIAFDAWSLWILMEELSTVYQALTNHTPLALTPPPAPYRDFAQQQLRMIRSPRGEQLKQYWLEQLQGDLHPLTLNISQPRPRVQTFIGASHYFQLSTELTQAVNAFAKSQGVTPYTLLLTAYYTLLYRHSGQEDICIASPTAGRHLSEFARTMGYFVNPVILRAQLGNNPRALDVLHQVNNTLLDALEHQEYPFSALIEALNPKRDPSYTPLSQVSFVFQKPQQQEGLNAAWVPGQQGPKIPWAGLDIAQYPLNQQEGQFELELEIVDTKGCFFGIFKYNTHLFSANAMHMLEGHLRELLTAIVATPETGIAQLPMVTTAELQQFADWNNTQVSYPAHTSLHQLIEQQVNQSPQAIAVSFAGDALTYAELNARANQLAHYLMDQGVQLETKVGVYMNRSLDMVIALLAILKAGGAYVPIDPNYPAARVEFMLGDINSPIVLTQHSLVAQVPAIRASILAVDTLNLDEYPNTNPMVPIQPSNLAYMIYTSGSTGNPKGAMNTHAAICNRLLWMQAEYQLDATDRVLQKTPFSFDVSVWEFFWPLMTGAQLVIAKPDGHKDTHYLIEVIQQEQITTLHFVPSMLSLFIADERASLCTSIKRVICSGEALGFDLQQRFFQRLDTQLHNLYGPTEAAIDVTYWPCNKDYAANVVPIGKPIANIQIHILDAYMQPVPVGVNGELHIGGIGLARGYHNRPELTESKFIADPFTSNPQAKLYKTGDLVRYLPDGNIDYLQRIDNQVKLRGFRIELGEVEAVLCRCAGVREAVVVKRTRTEGDDYLVAFITRAQSHADQPLLSEADILEEAKQKLPAHCVPSALVILDAIPLTPNGKVDNKALPEHNFAANPCACLVPPRSALERTLVALWCDLLKLDTLSITDNFFALGGHSLLAVRLMAAIEAELGQKLPLSSLIKGPTIEQLAQLIESKPSDTWHSLVAIQDKGTQAPLFFIPGGGGNVLYFYALAQHLGKDQPFYAMQAIGLDGTTAPLDSVAAMATATIAAIKAVRPQGPYLIGGHCVGGLIAYEITQQLIALGDSVEQLMILDAPAPHFFQEKKAIPLNNREWIGVLLNTIAQMTDRHISIDPEQLTNADEVHQLQLLKQKLAEANMVPTNTPTSQIKGLLEVFKANAQLHYPNPAQHYPVPITLLRAQDLNPHYDYTHYDDANTCISQSTLGWKKYAQGNVNLALVPGDHITMLSPDNAATLATHLQKFLGNTAPSLQGATSC